MTSSGELKDPARKQGNFGLWLRAGGTLLTLVLLIFLLREQGWEQIKAVLARIPTWRLWAALALTLVSRFAVSLRWHILLRSAKVPIRLSQSLRITFAGLFASNFLPTTIGGDVVRLAACVPMGLDTAVSAASLVVDRLVGMAGMALALPIGLARMAAVGLPALTEPTSSLPRGPRSGLAAAWLAGPVSWLKKLVRKMVEFGRRTLGSFALWRHSAGGLLLALLATCAHQACLYISIWLLFDGMGEPVSGWVIAGVWSLVYFITLLPVSINGYGLQEVSVTLLYARLCGVSPEVSVTVALALRTIQLIASLPGAFFVPGILSSGQQPREV
jgi:glycosyltransferase 2 family protein